MRKRTSTLLGGFVALLLVGTVVGWLYAKPDLPRLYEEADGTTDTSIGVGFVTVRLTAVARNDREGTVHVINGKGGTARWEEANIDEASAWLDHAAVRLEAEGGEFEILAARIFDHATREPIFDTLTGVSVFSPDSTTIEFNRIGALLPRTVDVWVRAYIGRLDQPSYRMNAEPGSSTRIGGGTVTVVDSISGTVDWVPWNKEKKLVGTGSVPEIPGIHTHMRWNGPGPEGQFHVVAVDRNGRRYHNGYSFNFQRSKMYQRVTRYAVALDNLDHFIVEPIGDEVAFFFEAVELPSGDDGFQQPPTFKFTIGGEEITRQAASFGAPSLNVLSRRNVYHGIAVGSEDGHAIFELDPGDSDSPSQGRTVIILSQGLNLKDWDLTLRDKDGKEVTAGKTWGWGGNNASEWLKSQGSASPLKAVDSIVLAPDGENY